MRNQNYWTRDTISLGMFSSLCKEQESSCPNFCLKFLGSFANRYLLEKHDPVGWLGRLSGEGHARRVSWVYIIQNGDRAGSISKYSNAAVSRIGDLDRVVPIDSTLFDSAG